MTDANIALKALSQALKLEREGRAFYLQAAEETEHDAGRRLFLSLADDEKRHEEIILQQLHSIEGGGSYVLLPDLSVPEIDLNHKLFPPDRDQVVERIGVEPNELDALTLALENEIRSYDLYTNAARIEGSEAGRMMYTTLASYEMTHYNLLMSNWETLTSTGHWR